MITLVVLSALLAAPAPAGIDAADVVAVDGAVDLAPLDLGPITATARQGSLLYVATAGGGVAVVDVSDPRAPALVGRVLEGKMVSRLFLDGDRLVALVLAEEAQSFSLIDPRHPVPALPALMTSIAPTTTIPATAPPTTTTTAATPPATTTATPGRVVEVHNGRVVFEGTGFVKGTHVKVVSQRLVDKPDLEGSGTAKVPAGDITAVVAVEEVGAARAMGMLGRGDVADVGDVVESTELPLSESLWLPRRVPFSVRAGFHARPFFGLDTAGFPVGALVDAYVYYSFADVPVALSLDLSPVGFAVFAQDAHYPGTVALGASYVTDWFEVGLGAGAMVGNEGPCVAEPLFDDEGQVKGFGDPVCENNTGFTFHQMLRLGALDGVHLAWASSILARPTGFVLGHGRAELGVPVSSRVGLFSAGGVGENGWAFGEIGVRTMFGGTGGPGTVMLSASLGGAGVFDGPGIVSDEGGFVSFQRDVVAGPAVGFGMEWRL
ncbi:MAG: hypothetical protein Q8O67_12900 [Deltaproteobacteria bacterium]|nr:hypothetical protein [Deltaproteobacteria bacterium]